MESSFRDCCQSTADMYGVLLNLNTNEGFNLFGGFYIIIMNSREDLSDFQKKEFYNQQRVSGENQSTHGLPQIDSERTGVEVAPIEKANVLKKLPNEIMSKIFGYLDTLELSRVATTCQAFAHPDYILPLWRQLTLSLLPPEKVQNHPLSTFDNLKDLLLWAKDQNKLLSKSQPKAMTFETDACEGSVLERLSELLQDGNVEVLTDSLMENALIKRSNNSGWSLCKLTPNEEEFIIKNNAGECQEYKVFIGDNTYNQTENPILGWLCYDAEFGEFAKSIPTDMIYTLPNGIIEKAMDTLASTYDQDGSKIAHAEVLKTLLAGWSSV